VIVNHRHRARVLVIGAGIVGLASSWRLQRLGYAVTLVDPAAAGPQLAGSGSSAALGVFMGDVFHRASGRAWRLRQQSIDLWGRWSADLAAQGLPLSFQAGLLLLAATAEQEDRLKRLSHERQQAGLPLELWSKQQLQRLTPSLPAGALCGLFSPRDGQLDPLEAMRAFRSDGQRAGLELRHGAVVRLERLASGDWQVELKGGETLEASWVVLASGLSTPALLETLGHERPVEAVLGQAVELRLPTGAPAFEHWPGAVVWQGVNLIPRPHGRLWLGATLEPGQAADPQRLEQLLEFDGQAPTWLREAELVSRWQGLRARPVGRPAPLLEVLEQGLVLACGHYRNGILLAPASAQWVTDRIEAGITCSR